MGDTPTDGHDGDGRAASGDARLTTRQGHPVTTTRSSARSAIAARRRWRTTTSSRRSATSTASASPSGSSTPAASSPTASSRRTARSATSRPRRTPGPSCSRPRARRRRSSIRFSTVIGGRDSSEAARDPRGFAVKFRTEDGNWDLVGNNLPVFFIRDAIKFPDVIHALKPDPVTFRQEPNRIFDFMSQHARVDAHADLAVQPARHPARTTATGRLRRQHLPDGQRRGRGRAGQVPLEDPAGRSSR